MLAAVPIRAASGAGQRLSPDYATYSDPATEFAVTRLTSPLYSSHLPAYYGRALFRRRNFLLFWSDRGGAPQAFRMNLRNGEWQQLTDAEELDGSSLSLLSDERSFCYFDGLSLRQASLSSLRGRQVYRIPEGWRRGQGCSVAGDGVHAAFVETNGESYRLRLVGIAKGDASTVVESNEPLSDPMPRPRRAGILYRRGTDSLRLVNYDGEQDRPLKVAPGGLGPALWSADGRTVLYLSYAEDRRILNAIREHTPDTNADQLVSPTSQFVHFGQNGDASVFVGASSSKASPYVLILLRKTHRELTLCEHGASDPVMVAPIFSPDSQQVYFESDRDGKPAIYTMRVEELVEKTDT
jgi:oligogalacturonide lyase